MMSRAGLWPMVLLMLSACLPFQGQQVRTLDDLDESRIVVNPDSTLETDHRQALNRYQDFLAVEPGAPLEREAMRRVADLQFEIDNAAHTGQSTEDKPKQDKSSEGSPETDRSVMHDGAPDDPEAAIVLYRDLLDTYPNQEGNDQVLYQLARAYDDSGRQDDAYATLGHLISDYSESPFVAEAHFRRAELDFLRGDYALAEPAYDGVLSFGKQTRFYQQSRYKLGWSLFKQESYDPALAVFFAILDDKLEGSDATTMLADLSLSEKELVDETLDVVSLSFSYLGGEDAINDYFSTHRDVRYEGQVYTTLADLYLEKERYFDAARIFQSFSDHHPQDSRAPSFLTRAIETFRQGRFKAQALDAMIAFAQAYDLDRPYWRNYSPSTQPESINELREILDALARHHHALAQKSDSPADYDQAIDWYHRYLTDFSDEPKSMELHYLSAEALFEARRYGEAAVAYERTAYNYPSHPWDRRAAKAAIVAFDRQKGLVQGPDQALWHLRSLASRLRLADRFPRHLQAAPAMARAAQDYFKLGEYEPAMVVAQRLLLMKPQAATALRQSAWLVIGHIGFDQAAYADAEKAYREALALMSSQDKIRPDIVERLASSIYQQGDDLRSAGDLAGASNHFLRIAVAAPSSAIVAAAEYDAAAALITLKQWPRAVAVLEAFRGRFPKHKLQDEVSVKLATAYLENGQGLEAAREFEHLGAIQGEPSLRQEALWRSAELYEESGRPSRAARVYKHYIQAFPNDFTQGMEARQRLAKLNLTVGNTGRYLFWLRDVIKVDKQAGPSRSDRSKTLAAQASLILAQSSQKQFDKVKLKLPLKKSLKAKKQRMEKALAAYQQAADYGIAEVSTAATYGMAEIYRAFGRALMSSQRPKGLSAEELEEYDLLLEEQAYPFEEDAIAIHEDNSRHASEGLYDRWVKDSYKVLAEMLPIRYVKPERSEEFLDVIE